MKPAMLADIQTGFMAFLGEGQEVIGAIRAISDNGLMIYVENAGDFLIPTSAVRSVHDQKVILDPTHLDKVFLTAIGHTHDHEDPDLTG